MATPAEMRALATTLEEIAPMVETDYGPGQVATYGLAWEALRSAADEIERLREIADAANELANTHFGVIDVRLDQEPIRERFFVALEAVFGGSDSQHSIHSPPEGEK